MSSGPEKITTQPIVGVKHILPMLPSTLSPGSQVINTTHHITTPVTVQTVHTTANVQNQTQQQVQDFNEHLFLITPAVFLIVFQHLYNIK
jgi:hypothetical protein